MALKGKQSYKKHLKSVGWLQVTYEVDRRDKRKCVLCGSGSNIEHHHTTYTISGKSIVNKEKTFLFAIVSLCSKCHDRVHADSHHKFNPYNPKRLNK